MRHSPSISSPPIGPALSSLALLALALAACGGSSEQAPPKGPAGAEAGESSDAAKRALAGAKMRGDLPGATVYDAAGQARSCEPPKDAEKCPPAEVNVEFKDKCSLAGYQMRRCGCDVLCAGNVAESGSKKHYDATGAAKACEKETPDCSPPPPSAAFQDACTDKGHRLKVCGCEWLCSGNPSP